MKTLTHQITAMGYSERVLSEKQLSRILGGSPQRRYGLVNRALKAGELVRIQRGLYVLADDFRQKRIHPFHIAQMVHPGSYVSLESALSYHGWIPEAVHVTASVFRGKRFREFSHETLGRFSFTPLVLQELYYLELVERVHLDDQTMLVARPVRALMDLVCDRKIEWQGLEWVEQGLRIDRQYLASVTVSDVAALKSVYKHKRMARFLGQFARALGLVPQDEPLRNAS